MLEWFIGLVTVTYVFLLGFCFYNTIQYVIKQKRFRVFLLTTFYTLTTLICVCRLVSLTAWLLYAQSE